MDKLPTTVIVPTISSAQTASNYVLYRRYVIQLKFLAALKGEDEGEAIKNLARFFFHEPNCSMKYRLICIYYDDPSRGDSLDLIIAVKMHRVTRNKEGKGYLET